ncbi:TPA: hypothetical protein IXT79_001083 [Enterococcus faecium]|uniref:hypothetical protein n=1 Tax=Enterococcus faecium TaxID=1352 RepID=UPI000B3E459E|nr:hypothetical protein [Enterococcus faecium]OUZ28911.1 hypothetical protein A5806_001649 [Enterococcus faecium]HAQ5019884.1 hypothetical protein [Enterococcus faecium]
MSQSLYSKLKVTEKVTDELSRDKKRSKKLLLQFELIWYVVSGLVSVISILSTKKLTSQTLLPIVLFVVPIIANYFIKYSYYDKLRENTNNRFYSGVLKAFQGIALAGITLSIMALLLSVSHILSYKGAIFKFLCLFYNCLFLVVGLSDRLLWNLIEEKNIKPSHAKEDEVSA